MRVAVLGGGYAGMVVTTRLEDLLAEDVDLVLVDQHPYHLVQHEVHRVIRDPDFADSIRIPFGKLLSEARFREGTVSTIDTERRVVSFEDGTDMEYDAAAITLGSRPAYYDLPGVEEHSIPLDTTADATAIGDRLGDLIDAGSGDVVVGGGGLAGIQAAGEIAQAVRDADGADVSITLLEQKSAIAPEFGSDFQAAVAEALMDLDVSIRTDTEVTEATEDRVHVEGDESLPADLFVWTGGIEGTESFAGDRPQVRADLQLAEGTFAAGDAARVVDVDGSVVPASAQTAIRQARVVAQNIAKTIDAERDPNSFRPRLDRYRDESFAWVVSVGDEAIAQVGPQIVSGSPAKALKSTVGMGYLTSIGACRNAVSVVREEIGFASPMD